jgi:Cyclin, C-terminal domain/Cyclin, N-terminal domain
VRNLQVCPEATYKRTKLVDWMVVTASQLDLPNDTLFLSTQLMDRYNDVGYNSSSSSGSDTISGIPNEDVLTACCALWLAAKYEVAYAPAAASLLQFSPVEFTQNELIGKEVIMLKAVNYRLSLPTITTFNSMHMSSVVVCPQLRSCVEYLVELSILDVGMLSYLPSQVAAAAFVWGLALVGYSYNGEYIARVTGYNVVSIMTVIVRMSNLHKAASRCEDPCNITIKYLSAARCSVASLLPLTSAQAEAQFLII